jgi:hypothetical protein
MLVLRQLVHRRLLPWRRGEETGVMGRGIESRRGIRVVAFKKVIKKTFRLHLSQSLISSFCVLVVTDTCRKN